MVYEMTVSTSNSLASSVVYLNRRLKTAMDKKSHRIIICHRPKIDIGIGNPVIHYVNTPNVIERNLIPAFLGTWSDNTGSRSRNNLICLLLDNRMEQ